MEIAKFITETFPNANELNAKQLRKDLFKKHVMSSYENVNSAEETMADESDTTVNNQPARMIIYGSKKQRLKPSTPLQVECNGLILNTQTWKPVVIPPPAFRSNIDAAVVNQHLAADLYTIMPVNDGTIINVYYWQPLNTWCISTARGYDLTNVKTNQLTYQEILDYLLSSTPYASFNGLCSTLDQTRTYTFGFKHPDMHPFWTILDANGNVMPCYDMWFVQSVGADLIPSYVSPIQGILEQPVVSMPGVNTTFLFRSLHSALHSYINTGMCNFGYILRSKNPTLTGDHSYIILESSLLQKIRQFWYQSKMRISDSGTVNTMNTIFTAFLDVDNNKPNVFISLFPQYTTFFKILTDITYNLTKQIVTYAKNKTLPDIDIYKNIVTTLYDEISKTITINPNDRYINKTVSSFIRNTRFSRIYQTIYTLNYLA
jgi:hypothetical protein